MHTLLFYREGKEHGIFKGICTRYELERDEAGFESGQSDSILRAPGHPFPVIPGRYPPAAPHHTPPAHSALHLGFLVGHIPCCTSDWKISLDHTVGIPAGSVQGNSAQPSLRVPL